MTPIAHPADDPAAEGPLHQPTDDPLVTMPHSPAIQTNQKMPGMTPGT